MTTTPTTLGENICRIREAEGHTQQSAAVALDVTVSTWSKWEQDVQAPSVATLQRIAELLDTTVSKLTEGL